MACRRTLHSLLCLVWAGLACPETLRAAPTVHQIHGTIVSASNATVLASLGIAIGDPFTVTVTLDTDLAVDINPTSYTGAYSFPTSPLTAEISGHTASSSGVFVIVGDNSATDPPVDFVSLYGTEPFSSTIAAPYQVVGLVVGFTTSDVTTITSDAFFIPTEFSRFDENRTLSVVLRSSADGSEAIVVGLIADAASSPEEQINGLMTTINALGLAGGTATSLNAKLGAASQALAHGNELAACAAVKAVISEAQAQSGKKLTVAQSAEIAQEGGLVLTALDCPP